ncbi:RyR domain-containing protein [uncultured Methanoregula sp.]|uniref:RyR domain-containing protein n=1 Tax=uncultured Methanoregula sp. TaxID=1005933 RepID=UPI002AAA8C70|nr:RyR domain-containing protein [uncultured Methanoregula sp.]
MVKTVVVAGDVAVDWIAWEEKYASRPHDQKPVPNWMNFPGTRMLARPGGAVLLGAMVRQSCEENKLDAQVETYEINDIESLPPTRVIHSNTVMEAFPRKGDDEHSTDRVFRVSQFRGFTGPDRGIAKRDPFRLRDTGADMVIIDDAGNGFRDTEEVWPLLRKTAAAKPPIILKMSSPLGEGPLWEHLTTEYGEQLVTLVTANDLRDWGVHISHRLSWERSLEDFSWQLRNNKIVHPLLKCRNLIVRFGIDGAIHYRKTGDKVSVELYYDPALPEDGFADQYQGKMQGLSNAFTAAVASALLTSGDNYAEAIRNGLICARKLFHAGFGPAGDHPDYQFKGIFTTGDSDRKKIASIRIPEVTPPAGGTNRGWTILGTKNRAELEEIAEKMVINGKDPTMNPVPVGSFEGLKTVDRDEIESFQSIRNLFVEFLNNPRTVRPLSIAVFGPPGSGKSFGVTQLAQSIDKKKIQKMEFNLSQFRDPSELTMAFHKIRDAVLRGQVPLAFFDEFDATLGQRFGWLKYFLAPMQDGEFRDGENMHPLGKAIFVFAGGTCQSFDEFRHGPREVNAKSDHSLLLTAAKGTDFISRLRGYIDIKGCNSIGTNDRFMVIRRAMLLRSLLARNTGHLIDADGVAAIDPCVVRAFLKVPQYLHGVRSMEGIIDMSQLAKKRRFSQSALPSNEQLALHVDADRFMRLVLQDVIFSDAIEAIAKENHIQYRATLDHIGKPTINDVPWEKLEEEFRESNRGQARHIPEKLRVIGCGLWPGNKGEILRIKFEDKEIEELARLEHERWMKEKLENGWKYGRTRDDALKINPSLVGWDQLDKAEKKKDLDAVSEIPERLADVGFEIYRFEEKGSRQKGPAS